MSALSGPVMSTLISFAALFLSVLFVQLGSGALGPLDALSAPRLGFSNTEIGLLGSAHYAGFFIGCWAVPRMIGAVGHARAFAVAAAIGTVGVVLHPVHTEPWFWIGLRVLSGIAIAGAYTVVESWLQAKIDRGNRARVFSVYRVIDLVGQIAAQGLIGVLEPAVYVSYNLLSVFCILCLMPLALTRSLPPPVLTAPRLRPLKALRLSPAAAVAIMVAGATGSSFRMIGPVYGLEYGMGPGDIAVFLVAAVIGAAIAQYPVGWLADRTDRRGVMVGLSVAAIAVSIGMTQASGAGALGIVFAGSALFGATSFTIYSVAAAYANDHCPDDFVVELNAALILFFSLGAVVSPLAAARLIDLFGARGLFIFIAAAHLVLIVFTIYRVLQRPAIERVTPYRYLPRTSMVLARLIKRVTAPMPDTDAPGSKKLKEGTDP